MKKVGFLTFFLTIAITVVLTLAFSAAVLQPKASAAPLPAVAAVPAPAAPVATPEKHPHIDEALEHMHAAKHELETAAHDFKGHRVKSIEHLNQAIEQAEMCMKVDAD